MPLIPGASADEPRRLAEVIARQERELRRMHHEAAARSVVDMAKGVLMERLSCSPEDAADQLAHIAAKAGMPVAHMAAELISQELPDREPDLDVPQPAAPADVLAAAAVQAAGDGSDLAAALLEQALAPAGAVAAAVWVLEPDGCLELLGEGGFGPLEAGRWQRIPPDMDCLPQRVVHGGQDIWWPGGRAETERVPLIGRWPAGARAVLALREAKAATIGVLIACWPAPLPDFPEPLRRQLIALAEVCANVVGDRLADGRLSSAGRMNWLFGLLESVADSVLFAEAVRGEAGSVADFRISFVNETFHDPAGRTARELVGRTLMEAYPMTARADGLFDRAAQVHATGRPQRLIQADTSSPGAAAVEMDIRIARLFDGVAIVWRPTNEADRLGSLLQHAQRLGRIGGWEENVLTGDVIWTPSTFGLFGLPAEQGEAIPLAGLARHVTTEDLPDLQRFREALLRGKEATGTTLRIVRPGDGSLRQLRVFAESVTDAAGAVVALRGAYQDISAQYHTQLALVASEQRAEEEHRLALRLQQAIMPPAAQPVEAAGIDIAVRYRPAAPEHLVGGDWYDTVVLPSKEVLLVVGDVAGHGIDAVTGMIAMRNCLHGLAITGAGPARLLEWLNSVACHLTAHTTTTVICCLYNPVSRIMRWARAGHLPPLLVRDGTASPLPLPHGVLLGLDAEAAYEEVTTPLRLGDALLLFTDGLVERRDIPIDEALGSLARTLSRPMSSAADYADWVLTQAASNTSDDACLVAVRML